MPSKTVYLVPELSTVPSELLWHELAARFDAAVFAGVSDLGEQTETVSCAASGSPVACAGALPALAAYVEAHDACDDEMENE